MAIWLLLSDFFVTKKIKFAGIILVVSIGYLIYQILYRSCKEEALKEFIIGYIVAIIIMIIFRTYMKINGIWRITEPYNLQELFGVWKGYITHLNLLGHRNILFLNGRRVFPFNGMLKIGYRYGTPAIFFYLIGWIMFLKIAVESFLKKDTKKNSWMICLVIIFLCNMMLNII